MNVTSAKPLICFTDRISSGIKCMYVMAYVKVLAFGELSVIGCNKYLCFNDLILNINN